MEPQFRLTLLLLHGVGLAVKGKHQKVHGKTQCDDGQPRVADDPIGGHIDELKEELERLDQQGI